jgi:hypothetical protein
MSLGQVYTPTAEVELATRIALEHWGGDLASASVCDPACGAGDFLLGPARAARSLVGVDVDPVAVASARERLPGVAIHHGDALVVDPDLFAWGVHAPARYDLVLGNPPYVRHQQLRDGLGRAEPYPPRVAAAVAELAPGLRLSRRADLSAAFLALGVSLLAEGGVLAFVTTSAWLDASYGEPLGRFLLDAGLVELVDRPAERTFGAAEVGSVIVVVRRGHVGPVRLRRVGRDVRDVEASDLRARGKWGGRLLRAPAAVAVLEAALAGCGTLGEACPVGGYLITGNDRQHYRLVEEAGGVPVVKSTRDERRIMLDGAPRRFLVDVPSQEPGDVLCVRTARDRHMVYLNPRGWASGELYRVRAPPGVSPAALAAYLSSAVVGLQLETLGRAYGGGGGPLKVERQDLVQVRLPPAAVLSSRGAELEAALAPLLAREIGTVPEEALAFDRLALERLCGALVGLSPEQSDEVRAAHAAAVTARVARSRRVLGADL